ncbi:MAG: cation transporter [Anaerolineaceae bacterium]|nr:cation transporter [Anaerolineaceae bacterium]
MQKNSPRNLTRYAWLSVAVAIFTIALKTVAYFLTGSVGLLSDALESIVNLVGALMALAMLTIAARPADKEHTFGHNKAEYFSSGTEGALIMIAAGSIIYTAVNRIIHPQPLEKIGIGLIVSVGASLANLAVALILKSAGEKHHSISLTSNAKHLMTDVWTSGGVLVGVGAVALTNIQLLDPLVAIGVALNIVWSGIGIVRRSIAGLMDTSLSSDDQNTIDRIFDTYKISGAEFHALRTRLAGPVKFISMHVLVPGDWTVERGHELVSRVESDIHQALPGSFIFTHLEPIGTPDTHDQEIFSEIDTE